MSVSVSEENKRNTFFQNIMTIFTLSCEALWKTANPRPFIKVTTKAGTSDWLYDSGASVTCMSLKQFRQIPINLRPEKLPNNTRLVNASGDDLSVVGVYNLQLTVHGRSIFAPTFVCSKLHSAAILGIDSLSKLGICHSAKKNCFFFDDILDQPNAKSFIFQTNETENFSTEISMVEEITLPPLCHATVKLKTIREKGYTPPPGTHGITHISSENFPNISSNSGLTQIDNNGNIFCQIFNNDLLPIKIPRAAALGHLEIVEKNRLHPVDEKLYLASIEMAVKKDPPPPSYSQTEKDFVLNNVKITVPENEKQSYIDLIKKNLDVFSKNENDLGCANHYKHKIDLKQTDPIYVKQFRIADAYKNGLFDQVKTWLTLGIIKPSQSKFNNPIFVVPKKSGKPRYVLDYRQLNKASVEDKYSMKTVDECISDIGYAGSVVFSIMDLQNAFHQMVLDDESAEYTSFTVPPIGQFKFTRTSQGLASAPSNFQRMMELCMIGLKNVIVYFDDLLVHTKTHLDQRILLEKVFARLRKSNLKLNPLKCHFGTQNVDYLGFRLTPQGILPGIDKLKCVREAAPPKTVTEIKQFLGLANFFRTHVRNFSLISNALTKLTRKDSEWKGGELPPDANQAFFELKSSLISEPCLSYPRSDRKFTLIVDAAIGSATCNGGLGAILCQTDEQGELHPISYASRALQKHEKNYSAFLIELTGCVFGIEHFSNYLKGRRFDLLTDHKPLVEKLSAVHSKTLNRLEHIMLDYDFEIKYLKGQVIPADYLSRNVLESIDIFSDDLFNLQKQDQFCNTVTKFLKDGSLPTNGSQANYIKQIGPQCFVENDVLWRRMKRLGMPTRTVLVVPRSISHELVKEAHGSLFAGHNGVEKCRERLLQSYFWPNMEKDIKEHLNTCTKCQARKKTGSSYNYLQPMPQCTAPNQRVHVDLFGPLLSTDGKKFILTATDGFTKYCEAWPINDKSAETVGKTLFDKYFCRYGSCIELISDQGLEFNNKLCDELCKLLQIKHNTTTAYRPQTNSTSEVFNKTIAKYLSSFVDSKTKNWIDYINPMLFAYNTSYHSTTKCTPYFLTYGHEARYPSNPSPDLQFHYGNSSPSKWFSQLQEARQMATHHSVQASEQSRNYFDQSINPITYTVGQLVWLNEVNFLGRNRKLSPNWTGPYPIIKIFQNSVVELKLPRRFIRVNVSRIKPYLPPVQIEKRNADLPEVNIFVAPQHQNNDPNFDNVQYQNLPPPPMAPQTVPRQHNPPIPPPVMPQRPQILMPPPPVPVTRERPSRFAPSPIITPPIETPSTPMIERPFRKKQNVEQFELFPTPIPTVTEPGIEPTTMVIPFTLSHPNLRNRNNVAAVNRKKIRKYIDPLNVRQHKAHLACVARKNLPPSLLQQHLAKSYSIATAVMEFQRKKGSPPPSWSCNINAIDARVDQYNLPVCVEGGVEPEWIIKRRKFLKRLSVSERNLLLTGDPSFQFDPVVYDCIFNLPSFATPPFLHQHFPYLNPQLIENEQNLVDPDINIEPPNINIGQPEIANPEEVEHQNIVPEQPQYQDNFNDPMSTSSSSSDSEPCGAMNQPPPPSVMSPPSTTRSGRLYGHPEPLVPPSSSSGAASSFLSRASKMVGQMMDSHPLSNPRRDPKRKNDG